VKNPDALERLREVSTVLLDKTGTITEGRASVVRWQGEDAALQYARALEAESSHRVARAFQAAPGRGLYAVPTVHTVVEVPGRGISGRVDDHEVRVGSYRCRPRAGDVRHRLLRDGRRGSQSSLRRGGRTSRRGGRHRR
jgi:cation transport ATPase